MNIRAEEKIIGHFLLQENLLNLLQIERNLFQAKLHQEIYEKTILLDRKRGSTTSADLIVELNRDRTEDITETINEMVSSAFNASEVFDLDSLIKELEEAKFRTDALELALDIQKISSDKTKDISQMSDAIREVYDLFMRGISLNDKYPLKYLSEGIGEKLGSLLDDVQPISSGLVGLDDMIQGLVPQELIVIGGKSGDGKTYAGLVLADNVAKKGKPVIFFSAEMSLKSLSSRAISKYYFEEYSEILSKAKLSKREPLTDKEIMRLNKLYEKYYEFHFLIQDKPGSILTTSDIRKNLTEVKKRYGEIGLVVVDYIQMIADKPNLKETLTKAIGRTLNDLRAFAHEFNCPIVTLAQVSSRNPANRSNKKPVVADICDSGEVLKYADVVMLLYREYTDNKEADPTDLEIIVPKCRNGEPGEFLCSFDMRTGILKERN